MSAGAGHPDGPVVYYVWSARALPRCRAEYGSPRQVPAICQAARRLVATDPYFDFTAVSMSCDTASSSYSAAINSFTFASIKSRTSRNRSGVMSLGSGICHSSLRRASTRGHSSPQPMVTAASNS